MSYVGLEALQPEPNEPRVTVLSCDSWEELASGRIDLRGACSGIVDGKRYVVVVRPLTSRGIKTVTFHDQATGMYTVIPSYNRKEWKVVP